MEESGMVEFISIISDGHEKTIPVMKSVSDRLDVQVLDCSDSEFIDFESEPNQSLEDFRNYRDKFRDKYGDTGD